MNSSIRSVFRPHLILSRIVSVAARRYVCGPSLAHADKRYRFLLSRGYRVTIAYWNSPGEPFDDIEHQCLGILDRLEKRSPDYVSLKLPAMGFSEVALEGLTSKAVSSGVGLHFDSHAISDADETMRLLETTLCSSIGLGSTLPCKWHRSFSDADRLIKLGVVPRLVKGEWPDPEWPECDVESEYLKLASHVAGRANLVRLATHDDRLLIKALDILANSATDVEIEILYGMPSSKIIRIARDRGLPVRVYLPYGSGSIPYALTYLRRNPNTIFRLFVDLVTPSSWIRFPQL